MKATIIQLNAGGQKANNLENLQRLVTQAAKTEKPDLLMLPEMSLTISAIKDKVHASADEFIESNTTIKLLSSLAREYDMVLHVGSIAEKSGNNVYNTSIVFDRNGLIIARYRKIHRFDVTMPDGTQVKESDNVERGEEIVLYDIDDLNVGCSICYDIRFSELYLKLRERGAHIIAIPAAFTHVTGADHWETLVRARAIETQCYVIAPNQLGAFDDGAGQLYGHSMIVDPWGQIVAQTSNKESWASATIDKDLISAVRSRIPVAEHRVLTG